MGFFDFLKKDELAEIKRLQQLNAEFNLKIKELEKYQTILDAEVYAKNLIDTSNTKAQNIIDIAIIEAKNIIEKANEESNLLRETAQELSNHIDLECKNKVDIADIKAKELISQASAKLENAIEQASEIIEGAKLQAKIIAGDAYEAKLQADNLDKTIKALKNKVEGYGDEYLIPTYTILDDLAEDFGFTEAGEKLKLAREKTRAMVTLGKAANCDYVEDVRKTTAVNFITDAFNGKIDSILSGVKQTNYGILQQKIIDSFYLVNNLGKAFRNAVITQEYLNSRIDELKWAVAVVELKNKEKEEQRRIKEEIREEEKARREFEKALKDAEKEESIIKKALEKAQVELASASEAQKQKYEQKLAELNEKLLLAEEKGKKALSMAQQTKSGHVYIISNLGSFGENIYKIGMTRRLEPEDRVRELGDASVPFSFDIHAMIYSENAPGLETELHRYFIENQLNKVNPRKEFFKVNIANIRQRVEDLNLNAKWTMTSQAAEYRESIKIEQEMSTNSVKKEEWERTQLERMKEGIYELEEVES